MTPDDLRTRAAAWLQADEVPAHETEALIRDLLAGCDRYRRQAERAEARVRELDTLLTRCFPRV